MTANFSMVRKPAQHGFSVGKLVVDQYAGGVLMAMVVDVPAAGGMRSQRLRESYVLARGCSALA
ncbi:hypothetical protein [Sphingopyxis macrogoltabida]|uniref:hypothetical protein n=2 Tax=Sphingomonadaceae TaxID=41297 RepID=UPI000A4C1261|nr:hypothetical protein [Sphingopyxis macrogoltabida]MBK6492156.1 hypothetical protein [Sphingomonadales bacterium]